ncbi:V-type immunoglobulin domain-containing suppressor of T-cell activation isoform X2 [Sphaerodactylus townsendi]|uniref:V-type immunoglobulin domain-containing suppressor of T-cell activation isoform X2 n=1 Tax=Sphaerodactylus townsendi TaxID=933632 RepID=UPI0020263976|nr:V-type immunoglobulin domain-containing suppressor of T-cell activation isoform X2 [Sphaerodactylus townsendi]
MDRAGKRGLLVAQLTLAWVSYQVQSTFQVTTPNSLYICPEGQNITLTCKISGPFVDRHDFFIKYWYFSSQNDHSCSEKKHIRNVTERELHYEAGKHHGQSNNNTADKSIHGQPAHHHGLEFSSDHHGTFSITIANLSLQDSGGYCCYVIEAKKEHNKAIVQLHRHGFMELHIQKDITAAALATGACIVGILCLPLLLILIYKQRQAVTNRRAHELVRLERNAQGIENPVFDDVPPANLESKPRPQLTYMASRQQSESGRHLLSEPNTPLSPPSAGECFFPSLEPVPDSPDLMDVE